MTPQLSKADHLILIALRSMTTAQGPCSCVDDLYSEVLGHDGQTGLGNTLALFRLLSCTGRKPQHYAVDGASELTTDEIAILNGLHAAQSGDALKGIEHLRWVLASWPTVDTWQMVMKIALLFQGRRLKFSGQAGAFETRSRGASLQ